MRRGGRRGEGRGGGGGESVIVGLGYRLYPIQQLETRYRKFFPTDGMGGYQS